MCELNPKHSKLFRVEVFTANPHISREDFERAVCEKLFQVERELNEDFRFRFHIHEIPAKVERKKRSERESDSSKHCDPGWMNDTRFGTDND